MHRIERSGGELIIVFKPDTDAAELKRLVELEQECGGAMFDVRYEAGPTPTVRYSTQRVELFAVLADMARVFDVQPGASISG